MLEIENLYVSVDGIPILKGLNLHVKEGEIHAIMGPNGAGKSTLAKILAGHPSYTIDSGSILFKGEDILDLEADERANKGLFMSFQYPPEILGVTTEQFLFHALNSKKKFLSEKVLTEEEFKMLLDEKIRQVEMKKEFLSRSLNEGFSGGEKKRNEILQMAVLEPTLSILDETDSGLDIDAMKVVASGVNKIMSNDKALILITHYQRLLDYIPPHFVHVLIDGKIAHSGDGKLALELEQKGYDWLLQ